MPIDPADVGREYEPIVRINSQSGKGGMAFILANDYGIKMPKAMQGEFSAIVQKACDDSGKELQPDEIFDLFQKDTEMFAALTDCLITKSRRKRAKARSLQTFISPVSLNTKTTNPLKQRATAPAQSAHFAMP
mgnify:CR=1 FL=1